jgi:hypothetical protein
VEILVPEAAKAAKAAFVGANIVVLFCASQFGVKFVRSSTERNVDMFVRRSVSETIYGTVNHLVSVRQYISSFEGKGVRITLRQYELNLHHMGYRLGGDQRYFLNPMLYSQACLVIYHYLAWNWARAL